MVPVHTGIADARGRVGGGVHPISAALHALYESRVETLTDLLSRYRETSYPLLIEPPEGYPAAPVRLMIIGQQTDGWEPLDNTGLRRDRLAGLVPELTRLYTRFGLGAGRRHSPFWQASHHIYRFLNPDGPENTFVWGNLSRVDLHGQRPPAPVEAAWLQRFNLLPDEIRILQPDVVMFFTGPYYDDLLHGTFPGAELEEVPLADGFVARVSHRDLPEQTYRAYHPNYLRQSGNWDIIDLICELCR